MLEKGCWLSGFLGVGQIFLSYALAQSEHVDTSIFAGYGREDINKLQLNMAFATPLPLQRLRWYRVANVKDGLNLFQRQIRERNAEALLTSVEASHSIHCRKCCKIYTFHLYVPPQGDIFGRPVEQCICPLVCMLSFWFNETIFLVHLTGCKKHIQPVTM